MNGIDEMIDSKTDEELDTLESDLDRMMAHSLYIMDDAIELERNPISGFDVWFEKHAARIREMKANQYEIFNLLYSTLGRTEWIVMTEVTAGDIDKAKRVARHGVEQQRKQILTLARDGQGPVEFLQEQRIKIIAEMRKRRVPLENYYDGDLGDA